MKCPYCDVEMYPVKICPRCNHNENEVDCDCDGCNGDAYEDDDADGYYGDY